MIIKSNPGRVYISLLLIIGFLTVANVLVLIHSHFGILDRPLERTVDMFHMNREGNLPTIFSYSQIFLCAVILYLISLAMKRINEPFVGWLIMSLIFFFLSLDEGVQIHEIFNNLVGTQVETGGIFYFAWTIPYLVLTGIFVVVYIPFLKRLPKEIRNLFLLSGAIFIAGAVGMEMIGGYRVDHVGRDFYYALIFTAEEFLEMLGMATFCLALLLYVEKRKLGFTFQVGTQFSD